MSTINNPIQPIILSNNNNDNNYCGDDENTVGLGVIQVGDWFTVDNLGINDLEAERVTGFSFSRYREECGDDIPEKITDKVVVTNYTPTEKGVDSTIIFGIADVKDRHYPIHLRMMTDVHLSNAPIVLALDMVFDDFDRINLKDIPFKVPIVVETGDDGLLYRQVFTDDNKGHWVLA